MIIKKFKKFNESVDSKSFTIRDLEAACLENNKGLIEEILESGLDINSENGVALRQAIKSKNKELIHFLLGKGANPNVRRYMPIKLAAGYGLDILKILIDAAGDISKNDIHNILSWVKTSDTEVGGFRIASPEVIQYLESISE
jgi:hypothetical protein